MKIRIPVRRGVVAAAVLGTVVLAAGGSAIAVAASSSPQVHACVNNVSHAMYDNPSGGACPKGWLSIAWSVTGPQGPRGPQGAPGAAGTSAILTVAAQTVIKNWPENSGWAIDGFTRNVTITRESAAPASDCGATAQVCWFYTETIADNGTFTTVSGHASPNTSSTAKIQGAWTGTMIGGGKLEFYASSGSPDPKLVPGTANGSAAPSTTTNWYQLFFPKGTLYGTAPAQVPGYAPWTAYDWTYAVTVPCGSSSSVAESWNDQINPGDDGQGAADGNITGSTACPAA